MKNNEIIAGKTYYHIRPNHWAKPIVSIIELVPHQPVDRYGIDRAHSVNIFDFTDNIHWDFKEYYGEGEEDYEMNYYRISEVYPTQIMCLGANISNIQEKRRTLGDRQVALQNKMDHLYNLHVGDITKA